MESYVFKHIYELLLAAKRPVFVADQGIDGDSLGSSLAMVDWMKEIGKDVPVFVSGKIPDRYGFLPHLDHCTTDESVLKQADIDLVVTFDCSSAEYAKKCLALVPGRPIVVNIDHHATNPKYGDVNQVIVGAAATAEVVHRFFRENGLNPSREAAVALLTGICFDTTVFSNGATNDRAMHAAADLVRSGAKTSDIVKALFMNRSLSALRVWGLALERLESHAHLECIVTHLTREDLDAAGITDDEAYELKNFLALICDIDTVVMLKERPEGGTGISLRSQKRDVGAVAASFPGGGGHGRASGFVLPDDDIAKAKAKVLEAFGSSVIDS
jgi:bifunctional oligoribonuclease and PAP phosphatase NrnA